MADINKVVLIGRKPNSRALGEPLDSDDRAYIPSGQLQSRDNIVDIDDLALFMLPGGHDHVKADVTDFAEGDYVHVTGNESIAGNKTFSGDVTVQGTFVTQNITSLETTQVSTEDNEIVLNQGETGAGVTAGFAGFKVDRGTLTDARLIFDETTDTWKAGLEGSEKELSFLGHGVANIIHVATNGDDTNGDGTEGNSYASITAAVAVASSGDVIKLAPGTYAASNLPDGVSLIGSGLHRTSVMGDFSTGTLACDLANFIFSGKMTINGTTDAMNLYSVDGEIEVNADLLGFNVTVQSTVGDVLTVNSGITSLTNGTLKTIAINKYAVKQNGGRISVDQMQLFSSSPAEPVVKSVSGVFMASSSIISNLGGGAAADLNNSGVIGMSNALSGVITWGGVSVGNAATYITGVFENNGSLSGTGLIFQPASKIDNDSSVPGATVKDALENLAADFGYLKTFSVTAGSVNITGDGVTAIVTHTNHGLLSNQTVTITGPSSFNGTYIVTKIDNNSYSFPHPFSGGPQTGTSTILNPWASSDPVDFQEAIDRIVVVLTSHLGISI